MFISNNRASFHLWGKGNFLKHQKVSTYYGSCCRKRGFFKGPWFNLSNSRLGLSMVVKIAKNMTENKSKNHLLTVKFFNESFCAASTN